LIIAETNHIRFMACLPGGYRCSVIPDSYCLTAGMVISLARGKNRPAEQVIQQAAPAPEPVVKIVEKIVEVEKLVHAPAT